MSSPPAGREPCARSLLPGQAYDVSTIIDARTGERFVAACPANDCWLVTSPKVADAAEKQRLAATYQAALVDMEAAAIARLARMRGIPFYCIKGISDGYSDQLPDFNRFISPDGHFSWPASSFLRFSGRGTGPHSSGWAKIAERLPAPSRSLCSIFLMNKVTQTSAMATQTTNAEPRIESRIPATMRAVVYRGVNDMRLETVPVPEIGPGELLVKVATCGVCGTDLKKIHTGSHSAPRIFGHEMAGTIVRLGEGVTSFHSASGWWSHHHVPCGDCYYCRKQTPAQCTLYKKSRRHGRL